MCVCVCVIVIIIVIIIKAKSCLANVVYFLQINSLLEEVIQKSTIMKSRDTYGPFSWNE